MEQHQQIKDICLRLLARREHSQKELLDKLALRGFDAESSLAVIAELAEQGWQSDDRYAESYARQRIQKGYGPLRIAYELQQRGAGGVDLDALLEEMDESWLNILEKIYLSKYDPDTGLSAKEWLKRSRFLQQRGFSGDLIKVLYAYLGIRLER